MSTPNARVAGIVSHVIVNRNSCPVNPEDNARTGVGVIACVSGNRSICHGYPTNNASGNRRSHHNNPTDGASTDSTGKPKTLYVSNNQYPISIVRLDEVSEILLRNKSGCALLTSLLGSLSGGHNLSNLITFVDNKVPMGTYSVLQEAENQIVKVVDSSFGVDNLSTSLFLCASVKAVKLS